MPPVWLSHAKPAPATQKPIDAERPRVPPRRHHRHREHHQGHSAREHRLTEHHRAPPVALSWAKRFRRQLVVHLA
eukprot:CAMPEP_0177409752 /NCGR_PEP_ID=MMETSP0368-20130122/64426_1 /TAXON_ID=447022 ORGANISM="Scrippsiella hangoei-like, Strain SHHI-4" /NCGR_SAMPLE_ID=MMETSP0368 /ASSEMBLY_ACC=CAM_ASM_000363 /LENGTH=74 /DNA_ID=CAMNT_0018878571 /DNA_START=428 /DNA_END=648 /DNA_ORIENTATION=-